MAPCDTTLCIFVKAPQAGAVKTRLATTIGAARAAELAEAFFWDTLALAERLASAHVVVALSGDDRLLPTLRGRVDLWPQGDGDLGDRLERNLRRALTQSARAVVVGTDSPGLPVEYLTRALAALETHDAVLGPADDGGFYLIGTKACPHGLLAGLPWSADGTREKTLARLEGRGMTVGLLQPWFDVDHATDLARLRSMLGARIIAAPLTSRVLGIDAAGREP